MDRHHERESPFIRSESQIIRSSTVAITRGLEEATGKTVNVVSSSTGYLTRAQQQAVNDLGYVYGKTGGSVAAHAEVNGLQYASRNGIAAEFTVASRPICAGCERALNDAGIALGSPLKSGNQMSLLDNLPSLTFGQSAGVGGSIGLGYNLGGAAGGYLIYPNKSNGNSSAVVYSK